MLFEDINLCDWVTFSLHYCACTETAQNFRSSDCSGGLIWRYVQTAYEFIVQCHGIVAKLLELFKTNIFFLGFIMRLKDSIKKYSKFYISSTIIYYTCCEAVLLYIS